METLKPASKGTSEAYTPQATEMKHSGVFAKYAPGIVNSGNLKHKWENPGDHSNGSEPSAGLKGD